MAIRAVNLLPATSLNLEYIDDRSLPPGSLRGLTNFRIVDGELWMREGEIARRRSIISNPWAHAVSLDLQYSNTVVRRHFLISQWGVLEVDLATWALSVPYTASWTGTLEATQGQPQVTYSTVSGTVADAHLIVAPDADGVNTVYYVKSLSAPTMILDRPWAGSTGTTATLSGYATFGNPASVSRDHIHKCSWTVFRQLADHAEGAVWGGGTGAAPFYEDDSPNVDPGGIYLIVCPGVTRSGAPTGPIAIRLDVAETIKGQIMRKTQSSLTAAVAFDAASVPMFCETWQERLFVVREDENNKNADRTIWFSQPGDMLYWHTGTVGTNATHAREKLGEGHDAISALKLHGDDLIVHRERSQSTFRKTGSAVAPFQHIRNAQGLGFVAAHSILNVRGSHFGWTEYGPAIFDGQRMELLPRGVRRLAALMRSTSEWATTSSGWPHAVSGAYHATRQQIWWTLFGTADSWEGSYGDGAYGSQVLVLDLETGGAWRFTYRTGFSLGTFRNSVTGREVVVRSRADGTLAQATQTSRGKDDATTAGQAADEPLCYVEFPWNDCGSPYRKSLTKIQVECRTWSEDAEFSDDDIGDVLLSGIAADQLRYQLNVSLDHNAARMTTQRLDVDLARMLAMSAISEGTRLAPTVQAVVPILGPSSGEVFKLRISNHGEEVGNSRPLRISQVALMVNDLTDDSTRREDRE